MERTKFLYIIQSVTGGVRSREITCLHNIVAGNREKYRENPQKSHSSNRNSS
jgi:hypothetical protein